MKFLDSNVVIYAFFIPKRKLAAEELALKEKSRAIIEEIDRGEPVMISVVHLSEIANVLRTCFAPQNLAGLLESFYTKENVTILEVRPEDYLEAIHLSRSFQGKVNDCLAALLMKRQGVQEIYTFDRDFTAFSWMKVVQG